MKTAIITDSSAYLSEEMKQKENVFVLDIPITIDGQTYIEGQNISVSEFYQKMAATQELPKTSQPTIHDLATLLQKLSDEKYTHVV
ncbi:MAG: DegV family protein, partial [Lactococcus plantarum]|nr:DegV family protein [Lactococcus plantarum]